MFFITIQYTIIYEGKKAPPSWTKASGNLVFDVKMDFTWKARWVKDGNWSPDPTTSAHAGVVLSESVRVGITYSELMDLDFMAADIQNAYLQLPSSEKYLSFVELSLV